jgi:tetratricopeptide (TPR) repeat protein
LYQKNPDEPFVMTFLTACLHDTAQYARLVPIFKEALKRHPDRKHHLLDSLYYEFLATGDLATFHQYEKALSTLEITEGCNPSSWRHGRMTVAMLNGEFDAYADNWRIEWEAHHQGHGDWVCPLQVNEEANHAALLFAQGRGEEATEIIEQSFGNIDLPPNPLAACTFDPLMIRPKLYYMNDNPDKALEDLKYAIRKLADKPDSLLKYVEKAVLLEAADLISPDLAYSIFKDISNDPIKKASLEIICANPWTYPHLLEDPKFQEIVIEDGRFVEFLRHYGFLATNL